MTPLYTLNRFTKKTWRATSIPTDTETPYSTLTTVEKILQLLIAAEQGAITDFELDDLLDRHVIRLFRATCLQGHNPREVLLKPLEAFVALAIVVLAADDSGEREVEVDFEEMREEYEMAKEVVEMMALYSRNRMLRGVAVRCRQAFEGVGSVGLREIWCVGKLR